jgi:hypothetical protein
MNTTPKPSDKTKEDKAEKFEKLETLITNVIFGTMIILTILGTGYLGLMLQDYLSEFEKARPDYKVPRLQDFYTTLISIAILAVK